MVVNLIATEQLMQSSAPLQAANECDFTNATVEVGFDEYQRIIEVLLRCRKVMEKHSDHYMQGGEWFPNDAAHTKEHLDALLNSMNVAVVEG